VDINLHLELVHDLCGDFPSTYMSIYNYLAQRDRKSKIFSLARGKQTTIF